jgi:hypothetical protein
MTTTKTSQAAEHAPRFLTAEEIGKAVKGFRIVHRLTQENLADLSAKPTMAPAPAAAPESDDTPRRGVTLRLNEAAWRQLKQAALDRGVPSHDLLIEALNEWFSKQGKPPIA